jgi:hypothetical protein
LLAGERLRSFAKRRQLPLDLSRDLGTFSLGGSAISSARFVPAARSALEGLLGFCGGTFDG